MTKLKAYAVLEEYESTGYIYFAEHNVVARRHGADELNDGEFNGVTCRRAPWADEFADTGIVPASVMVAHGWRFECSGCGSDVNEDSLHDRRLPIGGVFGCDRGAVYCSSKCCRRALSLKQRRKSRELETINMLSEMVLARFPDAILHDDASPFFKPHVYITHSRAGWLSEDAVVSFDFPGQMHGPGQLCLRRRYAASIGPVAPYYTCCHGDKAAFEAWAAGARGAA